MKHLVSTFKEATEKGLKNLQNKVVQNFQAAFTSMVTPTSQALQATFAPKQPAMARVRSTNMHRPGQP